VQLGDTSGFVEYWGRAQWDAVPAHFDCDEGQLDGGVRCPTSAHVLYLEVANPNPNPTPDPNVLYLEVAPSLTLTLTTHLSPSP